MSNTEEIKCELRALELKYQNLVWLGENSEWGLDHPGKREFAHRIAELYPEEADSLLCCDFGVWNNGFNSGMLAAIRFIHDSYRYDIKNAYELFPHLKAG